MFDYNTQTVINGISILNCIWGPGRPNSTSVTAFSGLRGTANLTINNSYATSDLIFNDGTVLLDTYLKKSTDLFADPANDDFTIVDSDFTGKSTAGDPRWRK